MLLINQRSLIAIIIAIALPTCTTTVTMEWEKWLSTLGPTWTDREIEADWNMIDRGLDARHEEPPHKKRRRRKAFEQIDEQTQNILEQFGQYLDEATQLEDRTCKLYTVIIRKLFTKALTFNPIAQYLPEKYANSVLDHIRKYKNRANVVTAINHFTRLIATQRKAEHPGERYPHITYDKITGESSVKWRN